MGQVLFGMCCGGVGAKIGEITDEAAKKTGKFMAKVVAFYIKGMILMKIDDVVGEIVSSVDVREEEPDENEEQKELEDIDTDEPIIACGVILTGYKNGIGPDTIKHVYYDFSSFCIRPKDSVIGRITFKHSQLKKIANNLAKDIEDLPDDIKNAFPNDKKPKKGLGKFHQERFIGLDKYFRSLNGFTKATQSEKFLMKFKLVYDEKAAERRELFMACLQDICGDEDINWEEAIKLAKEVGIDLDEVEMLKYVVVQKLFGGFAEQLKNGITNSMPSQAPQTAITKAIRGGEEALIKVICSGVETSWNVAVDKTFVKLHNTMSDALDKCKDTIKKIILKITEPTGKILKEKFGEFKEKLEVDDKNENLESTKLARFSNVAQAFKDLNGSEKSCEEICLALLKSIGELNNTSKYIGYLQYNMSNKSILEWFEPIKQIRKNHTRVCIALLDTVYVLSRSLCRSFLPLAKYIDEACKDFDKDKHEEKVKQCVLEAGEKLAADYFELPNTIYWSCWYCHSDDINKQVLEFANITVCKIGNLLGTIASEWKPESKDDVRSSFVKLLEEQLQAFIGERLVQLYGIIRTTTVDLIANLVDELFGNTLYKVLDVIDNLIQQLPEPLNKLSPKKLIKFCINRMVAAIVGLTVKVWASKTEKYMYKDDKPEDGDENDCNELRIKPVIRDDDYKPQELQGFGDDGDNEKKTDE